MNSCFQKTVANNFKNSFLIDVSNEISIGTDSFQHYKIFNFISNHSVFRDIISFENKAIVPNLYYQTNHNYNAPYYKKRMPFDTINLPQFEKGIEPVDLVGFSKRGDTIDMVSNIDIFTDLIEIIETAKKCDCEKVELFVKGFADGSVKPGWVHKLDSINFNLELQYHPFLDDQANHTFKFDYSESLVTKSFDEVYRNQDLPILRAHSVLEEFIRPSLIRHDIDTSKIKVSILEGHLNEINNKKDHLRMVQLFLKTSFK